MSTLLENPFSPERNLTPRIKITGVLRLRSGYGVSDETPSVLKGT